MMMASWGSKCVIKSGFSLARFVHVHKYDLYKPDDKWENKKYLIPAKMDATAQHENGDRDAAVEAVTQGPQVDPRVLAASFPALAPAVENVQEAFRIVEAELDQ